MDALTSTTTLGESFLIADNYVCNLQLMRTNMLRMTWRKTESDGTERAVYHPADTVKPSAATVNLSVNVWYVKTDVKEDLWRPNVRSASGNTWKSEASVSPLPAARRRQISVHVGTLITRAALIYDPTNRKSKKGLNAIIKKKQKLIVTLRMSSRNV